MPVPTDEQIEKWRERWKKFNTLTNVIVWILTRDVVDRPPENYKEAADRMWRVNDVLRNGEFNIYEGEGEDVDIYYFESFKFPMLDLRGIDLKKFHLASVILPSSNLEGAILYDAYLEGADLSKAHLEGADLGWTHLEEAILSRVHLEGADLGWAHLEGANLGQAQLKKATLQFAHLEGADFRAAHLEGTDLMGASLEGTDFLGAHLEEAKFNYVSVGEIDKIPDESHLNKEIRISLLGKQTRFAFTEFLPKWRDFLTVKFSLNILGFLGGIRWRDWWKFNTERWFYTNFHGIQIDDANTVQAADLKRYISDQQFLYRFRNRHPIGYKIWKWLTGCGDNLWLLMGWSMLVIIIFAVLYSIPWQLVNPEQIIKEDFVGPNWVKWLLVSFDIFTNLGIRTAHPHTTAGAFAVISETLFGFVSLGLFIAVATNKFIRRA